MQLFNHAVTVLADFNFIHGVAAQARLRLDFGRKTTFQVSV
jgi:hypothetical protein